MFKDPVHLFEILIEIFTKLVFSFSIIVFNMMKLLVIHFIVKLIAQIIIFKLAFLTITDNRGLPSNNLDTIIVMKLMQSFFSIA